MNKSDIKQKIQKLISQNNLGAQIIAIQKVSGGLSHKMYRVQTDKADFAIKQLNPAIMRRKGAYRNFVFSERVARIAKQNGINAVCALQFRGKVVLKVKNSFFMVFKWINAQTLTAEQVEDRHCEIIGQTLAKIHNITFCKSKNRQRKIAPTPLFDLTDYINQAKEQNKPFARLLQNDLPLLTQLNNRSAEATNDLRGALTVGHADLDRKNVMWQNFTPFLIDWESSGLINPTAELVQTAWYWAGGDVENLDLRKFETVIKSYVKEYKGELCAAYDDLVYANMRPKLDWLKYNLQRAFAQTEAANIADAEVVKCLKELEYCVNRFDNVTKVLQACF